MEFRMIDQMLLDHIDAANKLVDEWRHEVIINGVAGEETPWPFGALKDDRIMPFFIGMYDGVELVGILAYEKVYSNANTPLYARITAVRELLIYIRPRYRGNGFSCKFWEMLYEIAKRNGCRMESMNNVDAHLRHLFGDRVQQHIVSVVW